MFRYSRGVHIKASSSRNIHLHRANIIRKDGGTILGPLTVTKGRQTPLWFSSSIPFGRDRLHLKNQLRWRWRTLQVTFRSGKLKEHLLLVGKKKWAAGKRVLSGCFRLLNTLNSPSFVGICFVGNEWASHMDDIYRAGSAKAGHGSQALLYRLEN